MAEGGDAVEGVATEAVIDEDLFAQYSKAKKPRLSAKKTAPRRSLDNGSSRALDSPRRSQPAPYKKKPSLDAGTASRRSLDNGSSRTIPIAPGDKKKPSLDGAASRRSFDNGSSRMIPITSPGNSSRTIPITSPGNSSSRTVPLTTPGDGSPRTQPLAYKKKPALDAARGRLTRAATQSVLSTRPAVRKQPVSASSINEEDSLVVMLSNSEAEKQSSFDEELWAAYNKKHGTNKSRPTHTSDDADAKKPAVAKMHRRSSAPSHLESQESIEEEQGREEEKVEEAPLVVVVEEEKEEEGPSPPSSPSPVVVVEEEKEEEPLTPVVAVVVPSPTKTTTTTTMTTTVDGLSTTTTTTTTTITDEGAPSPLAAMVTPSPPPASSKKGSSSPRRAPLEKSSSDVASPERLKEQESPRSFSDVAPSSTTIELDGDAAAPLEEEGSSPTTLPVIDEDLFAKYSKKTNQVRALNYSCRRLSQQPTMPRARPMRGAQSTSSLPVLQK